MKIFARLKRVLACLLAVAMLTVTLTACGDMGSTLFSSSTSTSSGTGSSNSSSNSSGASSVSNSTFTISLSVTPIGGGTVTGAGTYYKYNADGERNKVTVKAVPNVGYRFVCWQETSNGKTYIDENDTSYTVDSDKTLTAVFEEIPDSADLPSVTDFVLTDTDGNQFTIGDLSGKPVVLIFGRMGEITCGQTKGSIYYLSNLWPSLNDKSLKVYFLDVNADNTKEAILENMSSYPNISVCYQEGGYNTERCKLYRRYYSSGDSVWESDSLRTLPSVYFISRDGKICDYTESRLDANAWTEKLQSNFGISIS